MIQRINLLHYLTEETYKKICLRLNFNDAHINNVSVIYDNDKVGKINLYHIDYNQFGHIWFMDVEVDFPKFDCSYESFEEKLYSHYRRIFGEEIMMDFPSYDQLCCRYIEYFSLITVEDSAAIVNRLKVKCVPEQLDKRLWDNYKKPHGTIEACLELNGNTIEMLARCHGTALKKRITDTNLHRTVGLIPAAAINRNTEKKIMDWLYKKYGVMDEI